MLAIWRGVEPTRAQAAEAALCVDAASQGAVVVVLAFVDVFAALFVVRGMEAIVALAAIPRVGVDAAAVFAQARSQVALVRWHLLRRSAEMFILSCSVSGTHLAGCSPAAHPGRILAAALVLGQRHSELTPAQSWAPVFGVAVVPGRAKAGLLVVAGHGFRTADAVVAAVGVDAMSTVAYLQVVGALVHVFALSCSRVLRVPFVAFADERSLSVDAVPSVANPRNGFALVHILTSARTDVGDVSAVALQMARARLAWVSPSDADGGAAQLSRAHHSGKLVRAERMVLVAKAWTGPVVSLAAAPRVAIHARAAVSADAAAAIETGFPALRTTAVIGGPS